MWSKKTEEKSINQILEYISLIEYNSQIGKIAIDIRKKNKLKVADAIIAATSLFLDVPLATADKEFEKVDNLNLLLIEI